MQKTESRRMNDARENKKRLGTAMVYVIIASVSLMAIFPILLVISGSFTDERELITRGASIIPRSFSVYSYTMMFVHSDQIVRSYGISAFVTIAGTAISLFLTTMMAYTLSRRDLRYGKYILFFSIFTLLFNGGMVSWFIVVAGLIHLRNTIWALIFPYSVYAWNVFLMRNFLLTISPEMHESAALDGAGDFRTLVSIILPLSLPALATVGLFICIAYWNDWWLAIMLVDDFKSFPLQMLLRQIMSTIQFMTSGQSGSISSEIAKSLPNEGIKMATAIITIGPVVFIYPFVQKYFIKGLTIGAIKG
jgi:putative aldouronate transport system permease protein